MSHEHPEAFPSHPNATFGDLQSPPIWTLKITCKCGRKWGDEGGGEPSLLTFKCVCGYESLIDFTIL